MDRFASIRRFLVRFWKESYRKALPWLILIIIGTAYAKEKRWLERFEMFGLDVLVQSQKQGVPTKVFVVEITNEDYQNKNLFDSQSPLNPLRVLQLIKAILTAKPSIVGVDIDTRDGKWTEQGTSQELAEMRELQQRVNSRIVWAEVPDETKPHKPHNEPEEPELLYRPILGGKFKPSDEMGMVRFPVDQDGVVRRYTVEYDLACSPSSDSRTEQDPNGLAPCPDGSSGKGHITIASLPCVVAGKCHSKKATTEQNYVNFSGARDQLQIVQASEFLDPQGNAKAGNPEDNIAQKWNKLMGGKYVLIGGSYDAAREEYLTSFGRMEGVELLANVTESEINAGDARKLISKQPLSTELAVDFALGTVLVWVYFWQRYHPWRALFIAVPGLVVVPFLLSLAAFHWFGLQWLSFIPVTLGMLVHQLLESAGQAGKLHRELEAARADLMTAEDSLKDRIAEVEDLRLELARERRPPEKSRTATGGS